MAKNDTIFIGANGAGRVKSFKLVLDELRVLSVDSRAYLGNKSTSANSVDFEAENTGVVTLTNAALNDGVATVEATGSAEGTTTVKATLTLASGEIMVRKFYVRVIDPRYSTDTAYQ